MDVPTFDKYKFDENPKFTKFKQVFVNDFNDFPKRISMSSTYSKMAEDNSVKYKLRNYVLDEFHRA